MDPAQDYAMLLRKNESTQFEHGKICINPRTTINRIPKSLDVPMATVSVTRRGQSTIPAKFRKKYGIEEGTTLEIEDTGEGLLLKKLVSTIDLVGTGKASQHDIFARLDKMRAENER